MMTNRCLGTIVTSAALFAGLPAAAAVFNIDFGGGIKDTFGLVPAGLDKPASVSGTATLNDTDLSFLSSFSNSSTGLSISIYRSPSSSISFTSVSGSGTFSRSSTGLDIAVYNNSSGTDFLYIISSNANLNAGTEEGYNWTSIQLVQPDNVISSAGLTGFYGLLGSDLSTALYRSFTCSVATPTDPVDFNAIADTGNLDTFTITVPETSSLLGALVGLGALARRVRPPHTAQISH